MAKEWIYIKIVTLTSYLISFIFGIFIMIGIFILIK